MDGDEFHRGAGGWDEVKKNFRWGVAGSKCGCIFALSETQTQTNTTMNTATAIKNESYLKISNLSDTSDFDYAISRLREITAMHGDTKQSDLLMGRLMIKRDKLQELGA